MGAALVAVLALWVLSSASEVTAPGQRVFRNERIAAGLALAPALYLFVDALALALDFEPAARSATPVTAALLAAAGALTITLRRPSVSPRWAREAGIAVVGIPAVATAILEPNSASWLVLVLGGLTTLILAIDADGLFSSRSPRKHLGWLALALATAGFWRRLAGDNVRNLEAYVLPLAAALVIIAVLIAVSSRRRGEGDPMAAPLLVLGGLLVAVLPLAVDAASGAPVRALVIGAACAALLLVGSFLPRPTRAYLDAAALSGAIGVLVLATGRAAFLLRSGTTGPLPDAWLGGSLLLLLVAAFGLARLPVDGWHRQRVLASEALGVIAMAAVLVVVLALALDGGPGGRARSGEDHHACPGVLGAPRGRAHAAERPVHPSVGRRRHRLRRHRRARGRAHPGSDRMGYSADRARAARHRIRPPRRHADGAKLAMDRTGVRRAADSVPARHDRGPSPAGGSSRSEWSASPSLSSARSRGFRRRFSSELRSC